MDGQQQRARPSTAASATPKDLGKTIAMRNRARVNGRAAVIRGKAGWGCRGHGHDFRENRWQKNVVAARLSHLRTHNTLDKRVSGH
jgi:hypothetical protein